ncbi:hypothetical protein BB560_000490 [Smittium megazygosporum]|uniref:Mitochondrial-processing peptidase subunit alpha n=1 Tax=Smittium megazygosporum TaxID=133381 RepID=A0A2T9ZK90_9FUNG|nr:hypothetical protein BB560_000490 [Smittium megazygosporum]
MLSRVIKSALKPKAISPLISRSLNLIVHTTTSPDDDSGLNIVTTFKNGLRVVSENKPGHFAGVGIYIQSGSRLSFKSTKLLSAEQVKEKIEQLGGNISCFSSRECIMYQAIVFPEAVSDALSLLGQTIFNPTISLDEVEEVAGNIAWEINDIKSKPDTYLPEVFHQVAYKNNTLGNPLLCPESQLIDLNVDNLRDFHTLSHSPENIVIAAIGVPHEDLIEMCEKSGFTTLKPLASSQVISNRLDSVTDTKIPLKGRDATTLPVLLDFTQTPKYTGGIKFIKDEDAEFTSILLGFESAGVLDEKNIYPYATLHSLMGGGGSFSAGGPGKGMYTRLYTNVLNQYGFVESCQAFHHCYTDSGLFGISSSCRPGTEYNMLEIIISQLFSVFTPKRAHFISKLVGDTLTNLEVSRAKNMLKSNMLMTAESRVAQLEDLGRQIQVLGKKTEPSQIAINVDNVTSKDISNAAAKLLSRPVTLVVSGKSDEFMEIATALLKNRGLILPKN